MARRSGVLEFAVLGLLQDAPMHGYELRKRLNAVLGSFRAISYGSLYPCLKELLFSGLIVEAGPADAGAPALTGRRARIVYQLTANGKERFAELLAETGPAAWDDERFDVHFAFFSRVGAQARVRILEGRRSRVEERLALLRAAMARSAERVDDYTLELARHGLDGVEREMRWLSELIAHEHAGVGSDTHAATKLSRPRSEKESGGARRSVQPDTEGNSR